MKFFYCKDWYNLKAGMPLAFLTEAEARKLHDKGAMYYVLVGSETMPSAFLLVTEKVGTVMVNHLDEKLREIKSHSLRRSETGRWYRSNIKQIEYAGESDKPARRLSYVFYENGEATLFEQQFSPSVEKTFYTAQSDISGYYTDFPDFGNYSYLLDPYWFTVPELKNRQRKAIEEEQSVMYDRMKWHCDDTFPADLGYAQAAIPGGFIMAWLVQNGFFDWALMDDSKAGKRVRAAYEKVKAKEMTGAEFVRSYTAEAVSSDMVKAEIRPFLSLYIDPDSEWLKDQRHYYNDLFRIFERRAVIRGEAFNSIYHVPDNWESYDEIAPMINLRYQAWKKSQ